MAPRGGLAGSYGWPDRSVTAFLALVGAGFSAYLTYLEVAVIDAVCQWCVVSAVIMTAVAVASVARLLGMWETTDEPRVTGRDTRPDVA